MQTSLLLSNFFSFHKKLQNANLFCKILKPIMWNMNIMVNFSFLHRFLGATATLEIIGQFEGLERHQIIRFCISVNYSANGLQKCLWSVGPGIHLQTQRLKRSTIQFMHWHSQLSWRTCPLETFRTGTWSCCKFSRGCWSPSCPLCTTRHILTSPILARSRDGSAQFLSC